MDKYCDSEKTMVCLAPMTLHHRFIYVLEIKKILHKEWCTAAGLNGLGLQAGFFQQSSYNLVKLVTHCLIVLLYLGLSK